MGRRRINTMTRWATPVVLVVVAAVASTSTAATPGELDTSFGTDGLVAGAPLQRWGPLTADDEGRIVVLGTAPGGSPAVARLLPDGTPDASFAGDGRADIPVTGVERTAFGVRVLADGTIVAAGTALEDADDPFSAFAYVARLTPSGAPAAFGSGGVATRDIGGPADDVVSGAISPTGVVAVSVTIGGGNFAFETVGANATFTSLQPGTTPAASPPGATGCNRLGFTPQPLVFTAGNRFAHGGTAAFMCDGGQMFEYDVVSVQQVGGDAIWSARLPAGQTIEDWHGGKPATLAGGLVVGANSSEGAVLRRYDPATGALDGGFGDDGLVALPASFGNVGDVATLQGNRIGVLSAPDAQRVSFGLLRLTPNGAIDPTFPAVDQSVGGMLQRAHLAGTADAGILVTASTASASTLRKYLGGAPSVPGELAPLQPGRLLDTRATGSTVDGQFEALGVRPADTELALQVGGRGGVPADAAAVVLNVTVVEAQGAGFVTAWPCDEPRPDASSLNFVAGQTVPNAVVAKVSAAGTVCLYNALAAVDLLADVNGYFPAGSGFTSLQPARLLDTRDPGATVDGEFQSIGTSPAEGEIALHVAGRGGVPGDAAAVVLNVTVVEAQGAGFVTAWPCDEPRPDASSLNFVAGQTVPNAVVAKVSAAGTVCLYNALAAVDLLADVNGYFPAGSGFTSLQPARLLDTRDPGATVDGEFQSIGTSPAEGEIALHVAGRGDVPDGASAVVLNVTAVEAQGAGFVTAWPCDEPRPDASSLNFVEGQTVPNAVVVKLSAAGTVCLYNAQAAVDLLADVNGYFP